MKKWEGEASPDKRISDGTVVLKLGKKGDEGMDEEGKKLHMLRNPCCEQQVSYFLGLGAGKRLCQGKQWRLCTAREGKMRQSTKPLIFK